MTSHPPRLERDESEKFFLDPSNGKRHAFPSVHEPASVQLSVIVPSYNEEQRLPVMMDETVEFLEARRKRNPTQTYEIIVVDDGSKDKTTKVGLKYTEKLGANKVRVLTFVKNRGKGGAVRMGMLSARGKLLLFADADGATKFADVEKLEDEIKKLDENGKAVVCGSRAHLEKDSIAQRSVFRTVLMKGFHFLVWILCVKGVKDTQCGFKMMTRDAARLLFTNMHVDRWAFDVEMLHIAQHYDIPVGEVAVNWTEIDGSKVTPVLSWIEMGRDLFLIRLKYLLGFWRMDHHLKAE